MKCSLSISNFLQEISSLSHSIVFLYFFALISEEGFLMSPCYSLELCIQMLISLLFSFAFRSLFFSQLFVRPPQTAILLFLLFFSILRPSPNYMGTSGFPVCLTSNTFLKKIKQNKTLTLLDRMPQWKENRPSILKPPCAKHLELAFVLFCFELHHHII